MSLLDDEVRPILNVLMLGESKVLSTREELALAEWAALKAMVREAMEPGQIQITTAQERGKFRLNRAIPRHVRVYLFAHEFRHQTRLEHYTEIFPTIFPPPSGQPYPADASQTTFMIGRIALQVMMSFSDFFRVEHHMRDKSILPECRMWPENEAEGPRTWPRGPTWSDDHILGLAQTLRQATEHLKAMNAYELYGAEASRERIERTGAGKAVRIGEFVTDTPVCQNSTHFGEVIGSSILEAAASVGGDIIYVFDGADGWRAKLGFYLAWPVRVEGAG
jgi:hypothetical protein